MQNINSVSGEITEIGKQFEGVLAKIREVEAAIGQYEEMAKMVNSIAMQTTILSLNASIEAARACSEGKGFAVVAEEIRNLAAQSQESVKAAADTSGYAQKTINAINEASGTVDKSISRAADYMGEISKSLGGIND
jgi:methyl-accepting chemotaxis protein